MSDPQLPQAPTIDGRTAADLVALLAGTAAGADHKDGLLTVYTSSPPGSGTPYPFHPWRDVDPTTGAPLGRSAALIRIFARFTEILIERLNRVPEKNLLAFLDLLGGERLPPQPARVPLTFTLAAGSMSDGEVPKGTRVAAPPPPGGKDPVEFETEVDLTVSSARLEALLTWDPFADSYGVWGTGEAAFPVFSGDSRNEHSLYIGDSQLFAYPMINELCIRIEAAQGFFTLHTRDKTLAWEYWNGDIQENGQKKWTTIANPKERAVPGDKSVTDIINLGAIPILPQGDINGCGSRWLRCVLQKILPERKPSLPAIKGLEVAVHLLRSAESQGLLPEFAFNNNVPLDGSKEFYPFGERPKLYESFYLASNEAFARNPSTSKATSSECFPKVSSHVDLWICLANGPLATGKLQVRPSADLELVWEFWDGTQWQDVGRSTSPEWLALMETDPPLILPPDERRAWPMLQIQGTAQSAVQVTARALGSKLGMAPQLLTPDRFGRFASSWEMTAAIDLIELEAENLDQQRRQTRWIVPPNRAARPAIRLMAPTVEGPRLERTQRKITILIQWDSGDRKLSQESFVLFIDRRLQENVGSLRVRNGRLFEQADLLERDVSTMQWTAKHPQDRLEIDVAPGRNDLLIEALDGTGNQLAAITAVMDLPPPPPEVNKQGFADGTYGLTQSGLVTLQPPDTSAPTAINGQEGHWLRVRIVKGNYGSAASYILKDPRHPEEGFLLMPEDFRPPIIQSIRIGYEQIHQRSAEACLAYNQLAYTNHSKTARADGEPFAPFIGIADDWPTLYLGLSLPAGKTAFPAKALSFYARLAEPPHNTPKTNSSPIASTGLPRVDWEYWNGTTWAGLRVEDGTANFTQSGPLTLLPPADFLPSFHFGRHHWWLRASLKADDPNATNAWLAWLRLNTTSALQVVSITKEILGSSKGIAEQTFRSARSPVLRGQRLEVREPERPGAQELASLQAEEGSDVVRTIPATSGRPREVWVRWHEVPDLYGSGPGDRHYTINHLTGEIRFGNGVNGRIPPPGSSNLLLASYRSGGGTAGNCAAGTVVQLKTTVPYVDKVSNPEPGLGGAEAESLEAMKARVPRQLRHQDRAVTPEDYEDLALLASNEVARVRCVPLRNLADPPPDKTNATSRGSVSVIIVPRSEAPKPRPSQELLERVRAHLVARADATAKVYVVQPGYLEVSVITEIAVVTPSAAAAVERNLRARLEAFLHPLTGGLDQRGWEFGRVPHRSDFFGLIEQVSEVDHCRHLQLVCAECKDSPGVCDSGLFLICSGQHEITLAFPEA